MSKKCIGCGAILQSLNVNKEGFIKSNVIEKSEYCERCFKIMHYGEYSVLDKKIDSDGIIRNINSDKIASVVFLIDTLNISPSIRMYINKFRNNKYILLTKRDIMPKSVKDKKIVSYFQENIYNIGNVICISSFKNYNIDKFMNIIKEDNVRRLYVVGFTNSGKSTFINHILTSLCKNPIITTSAVPNTTANFMTIKVNDKLTIVDTPGFIDNNAIYNYMEYNKVSKLYPKKEIRIKTFQMREGYSIVINDFLRIENIQNKNSFSFYMSDKLRYEKIKNKNTKLLHLMCNEYDIDGETDIVVNGLGFIKINKPGNIKIYVLDTKLLSTRKKMV